MIGKLSRGIGVAVGTMLAAHPGCSPSGKNSGETHWLGDCDSDADCGARGECLCGVCSRKCHGDGDCGGSRAAQCFETTSPGLARQCGDDPPGGAICLGVCTGDADCESGKSCIQGACVRVEDPEAGTPGAPDASVSLDAGTPGSIAAKYVHVDSGVSIDTAIAPPPPRPLIDGADDSWVGHWAEVSSDGTLCSADHHDLPNGCFELEIRRTDDGGYTGEQYTLPPSDPLPGQSSGTYPPATDPDRGYPPGMPPGQYINLEISGEDGEHFQIFEGHVTGKQLGFWISGLELWTDWCAMQTSYPFTGKHTKGYRCVPQGATEANTDLGKLVLCTRRTDFYDDNNDAKDVAGCPHVDGAIDPVCANQIAACACTAAGCTADLHAMVRRSTFEMEGTILRGVDSNAGVELRKVSP